MRFPCDIPSAFILSILIGLSFKSAGQSKKEVLHLVVDTTADRYGYVDTKGDTVIPFGKYPVCYTTTFDRLAIVRTSDHRFVGINRAETALFTIFSFDNGPDYPSEGLFRIIKNGKIGYADVKGNIVIAPIFDGAYPFKNGKAKVGKGCTLKREGEHSEWMGGQWYTIDKRGNRITP